MCTLTFTAASQTVIKVAQWWLTAGPTRWTLASALDSCFSKRCCCRVQLLSWGQTRFPPLWLLENICQSRLGELLACDLSLSFFTLPNTPGDGLCQIKGSVDVDSKSLCPSPCTWLCYPAAVMMMIKKAAASKQPEGILKGGG